MDGTDFRTRELKDEDGEFDSGRYIPKFNGAGLRYEIAIGIKNCNIVHINGPFKCGVFSDLRIARTLLHRKLRPNEFYIADSGYRDVLGPAVLLEDLRTRNERAWATLIRARHETINRRFKEWKVLGDTYRHAEQTHGAVFRAISTFIQKDIENGHYVWHA